jgi:hypothetical protein
MIGDSKVGGTVLLGAMNILVNKALPGGMQA